MNEGNVAMTYDAFMDRPQRISGVPGIAVRLGRALENWGRRAAPPTDREALRRDRDRLLATAPPLPPYPLFYSRYRRDFLIL